VDRGEEQPRVRDGRQHRVTLESARRRPGPHRRRRGGEGRGRWVKTQPVTRLRARTLVGGIVVLLATMLVAVLIGAAELGWPRVMLAGAVGAALASSGAAFQGVFRNPLADPFLLGAAAGAGMAATIVVVFAPALTAWAGSTLPVAAFAGAVGGVALSWLLSTS